MSAPFSSHKPTSNPRHMYWRRTVRLTGALLVVWFIVTFVAAYFARELSFPFFGWPFSFWVAGQGALLVYLALIGFYAWCTNRLDEAAGGTDDSHV